MAAPLVATGADQALQVAPSSEVRVRTVRDAAPGTVAVHAMVFHGTGTSASNGQPSNVPEATYGTSLAMRSTSSGSAGSVPAFDR